MIWNIIDMIFKNVKSVFREITKWSPLTVLIITLLSATNTILLFDIVLDPAALPHISLIIIGYIISSVVLYLSLSSRSKQISIRKVLGAKSPDLYLLIATEVSIYMIFSGLVGLVILEQLANYLIPLPEIHLNHICIYGASIAIVTLLLSLIPFIRLIYLNPLNLIRSTKNNL